VILTTSRLLTTGVDVQTCKNVVLVRVIESMTEFKQIIGRGTRVRDDYGKLYFSILDYTGSATRMFADPEFDGEPVLETQVQVDDEGEDRPGTEEVVEPQQTEGQAGDTEESSDDDGANEGEGEGEPGGGDTGPMKYYVEGGAGGVATELEYELDPEGNNLGVVLIHQYAADKVRTLCGTLAEFRSRWADPQQRAEIVALFEDRGVSFDQLAAAANQPDADPFDLLCHLAFNAPLRTRRERAERLRKDRRDFFDRYGPEARAILEELLDKYADHGTGQFTLPDVLEVTPISEHGNVMEIASLFGGPERLVQAVHQLQTILYAA
jgi:type I restriction enzyme R subunit